MIISWKDKISSYCFITIGTFLMAMGTNIVYEPMSMVTGGFAGIGIILQKFFLVPVWVVTVVLNIPLFIMAGRLYGLTFLKKTLYAATCFSLALAIIPKPEVLQQDYLMASLMGGALNGTGLGLVFGQGASTGGSDLLSTLLKQLFPGISTASILAVVDGVIVAVGMLVFGVRVGLYSIVAVVVTTKLMDRILDGLKFAKLLYIVSEKTEAIATGIMEELERGVTALEATGMYSGQRKKVLLCVASRGEAVKILQMVKNQDEGAFVIISDAREVMGEGFRQID